jgi:hypothetical protein
MKGQLEELADYYLKELGTGMQRPYKKPPSP